MTGTTENAGAPPLRRELDITIETSRRGYRLFAPLYDVVFGASLQHGRRLAIEALNCKPDDRILEVCVGSGLSLPLYPDGVYVTARHPQRERRDQPCAVRIAVQGIDRAGLRFRRTPPPRVCTWQPSRDRSR
jgi:hypothetical protein